MQRSLDGVITGLDYRCFLPKDLHSNDFFSVTSTSWAVAEGSCCQRDVGRGVSLTANMLAVLVGVTGYAPALRPATVARRATPYRAMPLMVGPDEVDMTSPRVRTVCVALLGQLTKLEEEIGELDFDGFSAFVDKLEVECDIEDKQSIFAMIDKDGGGTVRRPPGAS